MSNIDQWDWIRYALGIALLLCNVGVWRGVALEESHLEGLKEVGKKLLVKSLALEALFAAVLFVVDTVGALHQKAEIARLEASNLQLWGQIQPRRLTNEQQAAISLSLSGFTGHRAKVESYAFDVEGRLLAKQIIASLSPWIPVEDAIGALTPMGGSKLTEGVSVTGDDPSFRDAITDSLRTIGKLDADNNSPQFGAGSMVMARPSAQPTEALIFVGVKPLPK